jgi:hypothetical protein
MLHVLNKAKGENALHHPTEQGGKKKVLFNFTRTNHSNKEKKKAFLQKKTRKRRFTDSSDDQL